MKCIKRIAQNRIFKLFKMNFSQEKLQCHLGTGFWSRKEIFIFSRQRDKFPGILFSMNLIWMALANFQLTITTEGLNIN